MQIIMNKNTKMRFKLYIMDRKTNKECYIVATTLENAREFADWAENNGFRIDRMVLELES